MKALIAASFLAVNFVSAVSIACSPAEAQYIGKVTAVEEGKVGNKKVCTVQIGDFRFYQESMLCPFDQGMAVGLKLEDKSCSLKLGQEVSGILSVKEDGRVLEW